MDILKEIFGWFIAIVIISIVVSGIFIVLVDFTKFIVSKIKKHKGDDLNE